MTIELTPECYVAALWYMEIPQPRGNMLAVVMHNGDGKWYGRYRLRWYRDEKIFNSEDKRSWVDLVPKDPTSEDLVAGMNGVISMLAAGTGATFERIDVNGDGGKAIEALRRAKWAHLGATEDAVKA